jgi:hypothetical protein
MELLIQIVFGTLLRGCNVSLLKGRPWGAITVLAGDGWRFMRLREDKQVPNKLNTVTIQEALNIHPRQMIYFKNWNEHTDSVRRSYMPSRTAYR